MYHQLYADCVFKLIWVWSACTIEWYIKWVIIYRALLNYSNKAYTSEDIPMHTFCDYGLVTITVKKCYFEQYYPGNPNRYLFFSCTTVVLYSQLKKSPNSLLWCSCWLWISAKVHSATSQLPCISCARYITVYLHCLTLFACNVTLTTLLLYPFIKYYLLIF